MGQEIKLGSHVADTLTDIQGTVIGKTLWLYGCARVIIQPKEIKDGKMTESVVVDERSVRLTGVIAKTDEVGVDLTDSRVCLGDEVKDIISGFSGIVVAKTAWLHGCMRITVASKKLHEGKVIPNHTFDEPQLEVKTQGAIKSETLEFPKESEAPEPPPHGADYPEPEREPDPVR